ncbi:hypothetical protein D3C76_569260 [compost metagenome]
MPGMLASIVGESTSRSWLVAACRKGGKRSEAVTSAPHKLDFQARLGSFQFGRMKWHV